MYRIMIKNIFIRKLYYSNLDKNHKINFAYYALGAQLCSSCLYIVNIYINAALFWKKMVVN